MIRVAIVDDDTAIQDMLIQYIKEYEKKIDEKFNIVTFADACEIVDGYRQVYDIIFMDIQMASMDGLTGAEKIRGMDQDVIIIFVTNMAGFAIKGYKVDALSYVVKPILYIDFAQQLSKAVKRIVYNRTAFILMTVNSEILRVDISKVAYMESKEHRVIIHMEKEELIVYSSLKKLEKQVEGYHFARCNSGYLVSLSHVESVNRNSVVVDGGQLAISRSKKKTFMSALAEYIGGEYR